jgi:hypothetical protein
MVIAMVLISDGAGGGEEPLFFGSLDDAGLLPPPFLLLVLFVAMVDTKDSFMETGNSNNSAARGW